VSNTNDYIITTLSSGSKDYNDLCGRQTQAPFSLGVPNARTIRLTGAPYVSTLGNASNVFTREMISSSSGIGGAWVEGRVGNLAIEFSSTGTSDEKIQVVSSSAFYENGQSATFTIAAWISSSVTTSGVYQGFISKQKTGGGDAGWTLGIWNNKQFVFQIGNGTGYNTARGGDATNGWTHVVGVRRAEDGIGGPDFTELWINGSLVAASTTANLADSGDSIQLGKYYTDSNLYTAQGKLDEVGYWDVDLDRASIESLYSGSLSSAISSSNLQLYYNFEEGAGNSTVIDRSGNGHTGTLTNMDVGS